MSVHRRFGASLIYAFVCLSAAAASAQFPPDFHGLVDAGPVTAPACPCITAPFTLPPFRPGQGYGGGPATPEKDAPPSDEDWQRYLAERRSIGRTEEMGSAGSPHWVHMSMIGAFARSRSDEAAEVEAVRWLYQAAEKEDSTAFMLLGYRYRHGLGVKQNDAAAAYWFYRDAASGNNVGMVALGMLYAAGRGVPQDWAAAVYWWRKAEPHPLASRLLGDAYVCGLGVRADNERAMVAYKRAVARGEVTANMPLAEMYTNGCAPLDDEAAVAALRRAADDGYPDAQIALSESLRIGRGGLPNPTEAYLWARLAELRLPDGELRRRAAAAATAAARSLTGELKVAVEQMVEALLTGGAKPIRTP